MLANQAKTVHTSVLAQALIAVFICGHGQSPCGAQVSLHLEAEELCVTNGHIRKLPDGRFSIATPSSRATVRYHTVGATELTFRYLGPTSLSKPLASGALRRQIGLKLRAQDTCNLVYVIWRLAPEQGLAVSVKRNPGLSTHDRCGAHGYNAFTSPGKTRLPPVIVGEQHNLRAELTGSLLKVFTDGMLAWSGDLGVEVLQIEGPVGIRTDNAQLEFVLDAGTPVALSAAPHCAHNVED